MRRSPHRFGGSWTEDKLNRLSRYLRAYTTALKKQRFRLLYVDAFAGTGYRAMREDPEAYGLFQEPEGAELAKGSARVALEVDPPFHKYIFIEKDPAKFHELSLLRDQFPDRQIELINGDSNQAITHICRGTEWRTHRAVAFLDPYGMQVEWSTIQEIARTACIDLWYLFPVSMIMRLTPHNAQVPEGWAAALDKILPDSNWRTEFYTDLNEPDLFDVAISKRQRLVNINSVEQYLINGMNQIFAGVGEKAVQLRNSKGSCMYLLTFAVGNPRGADLALRMARSVLKS